MAPNANSNDKIKDDVQDTFEKLIAPQAGPRKYDISYLNVIAFSYGHASAIYGLYLGFTAAKWQTLCLGFVLLIISLVGIKAGAHRLWSHRAYKAKLPLQILLMMFQSIASQYSITNWVRDHRLHHRYSDTDADPHTATRGFFYSHIGWLLVKKHPEVTKRGKYIDMSDIYENPVLRFQKKYALLIIVLMCFGLPNIVPIFAWIGWAYDLKTVSNEMLESRIKRTGSKSKQRLLHSD